MARMRHRFNKKARQGPTKQVLVDSDSSKILVDPKALGENSSKYDEANALVLASKKRKTITKTEQSHGSLNKLLSRKQKKRLQKIVERREKKYNRAKLLDELQKHQLPPEQYAKLTPLVQVQTEGLKKLITDISKDDISKGFSNNSLEIGVKSSAKAKSSIKVRSQLKYRSWSRRYQVDKSNKEKDPMVLGFEESSSSSDDSQFEDQVLEIKSEPQSCDERSLEIEEIRDNSVIRNDNNYAPTEAPSTSTISEDVKRDIKQISPTMPSSKIYKGFVHVNRTPEIEAVRSKLPIIPEEQVIMESISENSVTVLAGETGSGKTTQVPQFLYEAGFARDGKLIGVTEPRRVAAISMSHRVAKELNLSTKEVSYQIRFEGNVSSQTKIKFMTDGVLLKEMEKDFLLTKYSAICIDEAHERSLYTDVLIGLLSRCVLVRRKRKDPLKLIIMSATMRVEDFQENAKLFKIPPKLIHVPTRQFPVQTHFNKVTPENYIVAAFKKVVQIHRKLPPGGILVFLTGQKEVRTLVNKLRKAFPYINNVAENHAMKSGASADKIKKRKKNVKGKKQTVLRSFDLDKMKGLPLKSGEDEDELACDQDTSSDELDGDFEDRTSVWNVEKNESDDPIYVLPLYSMLPNNEQQKVFQTPPEGCRFCVVSTNVAETSVTIPSIRYVVDTGKVKNKEWDKLTGVQQFRVSWCSKASAEQRSGRAGRTGPGHCYRLYSSAVFDSEFEQYSPPEIALRPVDDMMLFMKSIGIDRVHNFPYPTHPGDDQLFSAEKVLVNLGALQFPKKGSNRLRNGSANDSSQITELGKTMSHFPLSPRFSKMLALSFHHSVVEFTVALVAALTVQEVFLDTSSHDSSKELKLSWVKLRRQWSGTGSHLLLGDCMVLLRAVGAFEYDGGSANFCQKAGVRFKAMLEIRKLRKQLTSEINMMVAVDQELPLNPQMKPPTNEQAEILRQILLSGLPDKIAKKIDESELKDDEEKRKFKYAYRCGELEEPVIMHPSSALRSTMPDWVVYQEIFESNNKMYMSGITAIEPSWIPLFCNSLCSTGSPLQDPSPFYDVDQGIVKCYVKSTYGKQGWSLPTHQMEYPFSLEKFKLFAQFLLQGDVIPKLVKWKPYLLSLPVTMTKPWARLQPRTQSLLNELTSKRICDKRELVKLWEHEKNYLLPQYLEWLPSEYHVEVSCIWPPT